MEGSWGPWMLCLQCSWGKALAPPASFSLWEVISWWGKTCGTSCFCKTDALAAQGSACEVGNGFWLLNLASKAHIFSWSLPSDPFFHTHTCTFPYTSRFRALSGTNYICVYEYDSLKIHVCTERKEKYGGGKKRTGKMGAGRWGWWLNE